MDLLAILLLILPVIFKLITKNDKNQKGFENNQDNIPSWLLKFRNEVDNLFGEEEGEKKKSQVSEKQLNIMDIKPAIETKDIHEIDKISRDIKVKTPQPLIKNSKVKENLDKIGLDESEIYKDAMNMDFSGEDLLKSIIMSEILNKPVSKRGAR